MKNIKNNIKELDKKCGSLTNADINSMYSYIPEYDISHSIPNEMLNQRMAKVNVISNDLAARRLRIDFVYDFGKNKITEWNSDPEILSDDEISEIEHSILRIKGWKIKIQKNN